MDTTRLKLVYLSVAMLLFAGSMAFAAVSMTRTHQVESPAAFARPASAPLVATKAPATAENDATADERLASETLAELQAAYTHLDGVTVSIGTTPAGEEAVAYYEDGEIVVSAKHTVGIEKILAHEIWHVIDWRDNGRMDWGEDLPPTQASDFLN